jgi:hypothetical protein
MRLLDKGLTWQAQRRVTPTCHRTCRDGDGTNIVGATYVICKSGAGESLVPLPARGWAVTKRSATQHHQTDNGPGPIPRLRL